MDFILLSIPLLLFYWNVLDRLTIGNLVLIVAINLIINAGYLAFMMGMRRSGVTLTGVIAGSFPAVTVVAAIGLFGEPSVDWSHIDAVMWYQWWDANLLTGGKRTAHFQQRWVTR